MNNKELDKLIDKIQENINLEAKRVYGEKGYDRWVKPLLCRVMENPDSSARLKGSCGDTMEIFLRITDGHVKEASYRTDGCASSSICGSFAAEMAMGKTMEEILDMNGDSILKKIGKFPKEEEHCAHLAISTVKEAVNLYMRSEAQSSKQ